MLKIIANKAVLAGLLASLSSASWALNDQWYIGVGGGSSHLTPELTDTTIEPDDQPGQVVTLYFGRDFDSRSSGQIQLYAVGDSTFTDNPNEIRYAAADASLVFRFYDSRDTQPRGTVFGTSFYGRFGFGYMDRNTELELEEDPPTYFGVGMGFETYFTNHLGVRLEALYHDIDVSSATLTLVTRFGGRRSRLASFPIPSQIPIQTHSTTPKPAPTTESAERDPSPANMNGSPDKSSPLPNDNTPLVEVSEPTATGNTGSAESPLTLPTLSDISQESVLSTPASSQPAEPINKAVNASESINGDLDSDGIVDSADRCPDSTPGYPVSTRGCPVFGGLMPGLTFNDGTADLSPESFAKMDAFAQKLIDYPDAEVEIVAHTDDANGNADQRSNLTRQRLRTIGIYLVNLGINKERLLLRSFGDNRPAHSNATEEGRQRNNRIEVFENP